MNRNFKELLKNCEKRVYTFQKDGYSYQEEYEYYELQRYIKCNIHGSLKDERLGGSVEVYIRIDNLTREHTSGFGYLEVILDRWNKGIGTALMKDVFSVIKELKEYFNVHDTVRLTGWLFITDKINGNWSRSVPFYEKVGIKTGTKTEFKIKNTGRIIERADEFLREVGDSEGTVIYHICS
jgi:GNAT superfamily N-acetyltransferase